MPAPVEVKKRPNVTAGLAIACVLVKVPAANTHAATVAAIRLPLPELANFAINQTKPAVAKTSLTTSAGVAKMLPVLKVRLAPLFQIVEPSATPATLPSS